MTALGDDVRAAAVPPDVAGARWRQVATSSDVEVETPYIAATDWDGILNHFGLDPGAFEVVDDSVRVASWQQSKGLEDGSRDKTWLYSYRAKFRRRTADTIALDALAAKWERRLVGGVPAAKVRRAKGTSPAYVILPSDAQFGKKRTGEAVENYRRGITGHVERLRRIIDAGFWKPGEIVLAFQGDEIEGVANNYANQAHTVEMNLSRQMELDFSLRVWAIEQVAALGLPVLVTSVISNHGEITRNGSKDPVTTKADNASTLIARLVKQLVERIPALSHVRFNIAEGNPDIVTEVGGKLVLFSHGHVAKGRGSSTEQRTKNAIERQILGRTKELVDVDLFFVAHYHHLYLLEFEGRTLFGCPALEAEQSSEYMLEQYGVWSRPGMLGLLVGTACGPRGYAEPEVL
jgi:hypothetical protein